MEQFSYLNIDQLLLNSRSTDIRDSVTVITSFTRAKHGLSTVRRTRTRAIDSYTKTRNQFFEYLEGRGYVIFKCGGEWIAMRDHENEYVDVTAIFSITDATIDARIFGNREEVDTIVTWIDANCGQRGTLVNTAVDVSDRGEIIFNAKYMPDDTSKTAKQSFYPWLDVPLEEYYKAYMESDESVLILFGPPGVGKSTFLRSLIMSGNYDTMLAYNKKVVESANLIGRFYRGTARILAYEDIDTHMKSREDGNLLMAPFLNSSQGIIPHPEKKIVFSTNLPSIDRIDPALLRRGRCFDILPFRELTPDEAADACHAVGLPPKDWSLKDKWPLAEVLSKEVAAQQTVNRYGRKAGFY